MNLSLKQWLAILAGLAAFIAVSGTQLTEIAGPAGAKTITALAGLLSGGLNVVIAIIAGQASTVKEVAAMPGVETIKVNSQANSTLAAVAVDPAQSKVEAVSPAVEQTLTQKANG